MALILASKSASRLNLLKSAGLNITVRPSDIDENKIKEKMITENAAFEEIALTLARKKALKISSISKNDTVIGSDQILECDGKLFDKARDTSEAMEHLKFFRAKDHKLITAVVLVQNETIVWSNVTVPTLHMRNFSDRFLNEYISKAGSALTKSVGAYFLEDVGAQLFSRIEGDYHAILGLPLIPLFNKLRELKLIDD